MISAFILHQFWWLYLWLYLHQIICDLHSSYQGSFSIATTKMICGCYHRTRQLDGTVIYGQHTTTHSRIIYVHSVARPRIF